MEKFLDKNGLITYTNKMKEYINSKVGTLSSDWNDLENRPFYDGRTALAEISKTLYSYYHDDSRGDGVSLNSGNHYNVTYDGVLYENLTPYEYVVYSAEYPNGKSRYYLGNSNYLYNEGDPVNPISSDIPFCIEEVTPGYYTNFATLTAGSHSFLIEEVGTSNSFSYTTDVNSSLGAREIVIKALNDGDVPIYSYGFKNLFNPVGLTSLIVNFNGITSEYQIEEEHNSEEGWTRYYIGDITDSNSFELEWGELEGDWYFNYNIPTEAFSLTAPGLSQTFTISITTGQLHQLDTKYIPTASSIADGETGFVTGDQVYDALQNAGDDKWGVCDTGIIWLGNNPNVGTATAYLKFKLFKNGVAYTDPVYVIYTVETEDTIAGSNVPSVTYKSGLATANTSNGNTYSMQLKRGSSSTFSITNYNFLNVSGTIFEDYINASTSEMKKPITDFQCSSYVHKPAQTDYASYTKGFITAGETYSLIKNQGYLTPTSSVITGKANKSELAKVATSGEYADLQNIPIQTTNVLTGNSITNFPEEIVDFVEIVPTSQYSNNIIVDYNTTV